MQKPTIKEKVRVTFRPQGKTVYVKRGTSLYDAIRKAGIPLKSECGGIGVCGSCMVRVIEGSCEQRGSEGSVPARRANQGDVLACRTEILSHMVVEIPVSSTILNQKILTEAAQRQVRLDPQIRKRFLRVEKPTLADQRPLLDRVIDASGLRSVPHAIGVEVLRELPSTLRDGDYTLTIVSNENEIIGLEKGDTSDRVFGAAFDIGTTTVAGYLLNLNTGEQLAVASRTNPQASYGDDVVSRIHYTTTKEGGLKDLNEVVVSCINDILTELALSAGIEREHIYEVVFAANTTMNHLLLSLDPRSIALSPYVAVLRAGLHARSRDLNIRINRNGRAYVMPNIAGFIGGDTVALILATRMHKSDRLRLSIDIGTNGELVIGNRERLIACSAAAGPAFEGARIMFGMRAAEGAIQEVSLSKKGIEIETIGNAKPIGLCGTGLIGSIAELRKAGVITHDGRLIDAEELSPGTSDFIRKRIFFHREYGNSFILVPAGESGPGKDILLTQKDVREVQLAKGAILAGFRVMKNLLGIDEDDIQELLLAGAFGSFIRKDQAKYIGLLPDIPLGRIRFIGNAAGAGAKMALLSKELRKEASAVSSNIEHVELAVQKDFQTIFAESMFFPH